MTTGLVEKSIFSSLTACLNVSYSIISGAIQPKNNTAVIMSQAKQRGVQYKPIGIFDGLTEHDKHALAASIIGKTTQLSPRLNAALNAYYVENKKKRQFVDAWAQLYEDNGIIKYQDAMPIKRAFTWRAVNDGKTGGLGISPETIAALFQVPTTSMERMATTINKDFQNDVVAARAAMRELLFGCGIIPG